MTAPLGVPQAGKIGIDDQRRGVRTHQHFQDLFTGDGTKTRFALSKTPRDTSQMGVYVAGLRQRPKVNASANDFAVDGASVVFVSAPANGAPILIDLVI